MNIHNSKDKDEESEGEYIDYSQGVILIESTKSRR